MTAVQSDATIVDAVVQAVPGKVSRGGAFHFPELFRREVAREVMFEDLVPPLKHFARRHPTVDSWASRPILENARARSMAKLAGGELTFDQQEVIGRLTAQIFTEIDTPQ